jgi:hypothetical protein
MVLGILESKKIMTAFLRNIFLACFIVSSCARADKANIYNDLIDDLITKGSIYPTPPTKEDEKRWGNLWERYPDSHFDQDVYKRLQDSTVCSIKDAEPKWTLLYIEEMKYADYWPEYGHSWIEDFFDEDFPITGKESMIDTLSTLANVKYDDLNVRYLDIFQSINEDRNGPCTLAFSKAFFNKKGDKAIVYYEWCNRGEVLYVTDISGKWKIQKSGGGVEH